MGDQTLQINIVIDNKVINIPYNETTTAEDVCIALCKQLGIGVVARHLFALRTSRKQIFLMPSEKHLDKKNSYDFRIRFKVSNINRLRKIDLKAYDYYFHQARSDVLDNRIPDLVFEKYRRELVGLGVTDMYRVMLEKDIPQETVENDYKKYIPKEVLKRHAFFIKKPVHESLAKITKAAYDVWFVKAEYLKQLDMMVPEYLAEEFKAVIDEDGSTSSIIIRVTPFHPTEPGVKYCYESKREQFVQICTFEELGFVSIRKDGTVEISRKNGIPFYLKFNSINVMYSFVSLLDGYYRLTCKWTFNICKDVQTPSLLKLYSMKCHGPVGGEFSYAKLEEKYGNRPGCFILRESEFKYNIYYIDVCVKENTKPKTFKLERLTGDEFIFNDDLTRYRSIRQLMTAYSDPQGTIYLGECIPPSEYDKSPLLLCQPINLAGDSITDSSILNNINGSVPICILNRDLQVYKGQKKEGSEGITVVYKCMWKLTKGKKLEVAMKLLKQESKEQYLKEFLDLAGQWAFLKSSTIVKLYGVTLSNQFSMIMEYVRLGPLDQYLKVNRGRIKTVDLIEACSNLASALWHLEENRIVHGRIRCRKLLMSCHDENCFQIKLMDPGIHSSYSASEVPWIPIECYKNREYARRSTAADVWAFATTLWEIFTFGAPIQHADHMEAMQGYANSKRLPRPANCPEDIYTVMLRCWHADPHQRMQPQAIVRDINQLLYEVYNSRRKHCYSTVHIKHPNSDMMPGPSTSTLASAQTENTLLELLPVSQMSELDNDFSSASSYYDKNLSPGWSSQEFTDDDNCFSDGDFSNIMSAFSFPTVTTSLENINSLESIFELDSNGQVVLQGKIGQGFYGEVYQGTLEYFDKDREPRKVAVKKLKTNALSACLQDFEREIAIMKTLNHPNIVEILGVLPEIALVMEFVHHGSLQSYLKIYKESLSEKQLLKYASDIAKGMDYLGTKNIVHRDLAARNILVVDENHVKISDFGLAQVIGSNDYYILKTSRELPIKWYALESLRNGKFSLRSDVWSFGVTMCEMFSHGEEPVLPNVANQNIEGQEQQILVDALQRGIRFPCPLLCPQALYVRIIYPCWHENPHARPTFKQLHSEISDLLNQY